MAKLKNYAVKTGKTTVVVQLSEETKNRLYPEAVEVIRQPKVKEPAPKPEGKDSDGGDGEDKQTEETQTGENTPADPPAPATKPAKK